MSHYPPKITCYLKDGNYLEYYACNADGNLACKWGPPILDFYRFKNRSPTGHPLHEEFETIFRSCRFAETSGLENWEIIDR